jgi:hypothetical protein
MMGALMMSNSKHYLDYLTEINHITISGTHQHIFFFCVFFIKMIIFGGVFEIRAAAVLVNAKSSLMAVTY